MLVGPPRSSTHGNFVGIERPRRQRRAALAFEREFGVDYPSIADRRAQACSRSAALTPRVAAGDRTSSTRGPGRGQHPRLVIPSAHPRRPRRGGRGRAGHRWVTGSSDTAAAGSLALAAAGGGWSPGWSRSSPLRDPAAARLPVVRDRPVRRRPRLREAGTRRGRMLAGLAAVRARLRRGLRARRRHRSAASGNWLRTWDRDQITVVMGVVADRARPGLRRPGAVAAAGVADPHGPRRRARRGAAARRALRARLDAVHRPDLRRHRRPRLSPSAPPAAGPCSSAATRSGSASRSSSPASSTSRSLGALGFVRRHQLVVMRIGGAMLVAIGVLLVTGWWDRAVQWLQVRLVGGFEVSLSSGRSPSTQRPEDDRRPGELGFRELRAGCGARSPRCAPR